MNDRPVAGGDEARVTVGLNAIRSDHPVRHGQAAQAFIRSIGLWWGDQLTMLRLRCAGDGEMPA